MATYSVLNRTFEQHTKDCLSFCEPFLFNYEYLSDCLHSESGEVSDVLKDMQRYKDRASENLENAHMELGDVLWCLTTVAACSNVSFGSCVYAAGVASDGTLMSLHLDATKNHSKHLATIHAMYKIPQGSIHGTLFEQSARMLTILCDEIRIAIVRRKTGTLFVKLLGYAIICLAVAAYMLDSSIFDISISNRNKLIERYGVAA